MKVNFLQQIGSFFYPIKIASAAGKSTPTLSLYRFSGRWQLGAATALYSDGAAYLPLKFAFSFLKKRLTKTDNMLLLGGGLGSAISVLHKMNLPLPKTTIVEIDPQIIAWGKEIIVEDYDADCEWICANASTFVAENKQTFDLVILDIFQDRQVPHFVCTAPFLQQCAALLCSKEATLVFNYIINNEATWHQDYQTIQEFFAIEKCIEIGQNRVFILKKK